MSCIKIKLPFVAYTVLPRLESELEYRHTSAERMGKRLAAGGAITKRALAAS